MFIVGLLLNLLSIIVIIALAAGFFLLLFFIIKKAVKDGILEANKEIEKRKTQRQTGQGTKGEPRC